MFKQLALSAAIALGLGGTAFAADVAVGDLVIADPHARATPPNAPVSAGYMVIRNTGQQADRLVAGSADFAGKVEVHEMAMDGGVMKMRPVTGGLEIPAGGEVELKPGGYHLMFMQLGEKLEEGATVKGRLVFEKAGEVEIEFPVRRIEGAKPAGQMKHGG